MITIYRSEASASLRRIPMWLVGSDGTTPPVTQAGGQPQAVWYARGTATANTAATLSAVSVLGGEYYIELSASEVSALGVAAVQYKAAGVLPSSTYFQIANFDSGDSTRLGLFALPNAAAAAAGGLLTFGTGSGQINPSAGSVDAQYLDLSSKFTVGVGKIAAGTYSSVTIDGVSRVNSSVTIADATYSAVTVRLGSVDYSSAVTVGVGKIASANYSGVSVEITNASVTAGQAIADRFLLRDLAGGDDSGRSVGDALRSLRNRVLIGASIGTVFQEDDTTSAWTFSISTTASAVFLTEINPAGGTS